jgi:hypothetical protein
MPISTSRKDKQMTNGGPYLDIGIGGVQRNVSDISGVFNTSARLQIPRDFTPEHLRLAEVDLEIIAKKLRENAEEVRMLLQAFVDGRNSDVERQIKELGLTEADFQAQGGGIFVLVVVVGVLCCAGAAY